MLLLLLLVNPLKLSIVWVWMLLLELLGPGSLMMLLLVPHVCHANVLKLVVQLAHVQVLMLVERVTELPLLTKELTNKLGAKEATSMDQSEKKTM